MQRLERYSLAEQAAWFFQTADLWPDVYSLPDLTAFWSAIGVLTVDTPERRPEYLRAALLRRLSEAANVCERCPSAANRLNNRAVLDDSSYQADLFAQTLGNRIPTGALGAELMVIGEGPGATETRTGQPFCSTVVTLGSFCAQACDNLESCFPNGASQPKALCEFSPLTGRAVSTATDHGVTPQERLVQLKTERVSQKLWRMHTAGQILDQILTKTGYWRESWNSYGLLRGKEARPATVYLTNTVKCRSAVLNANSLDGLEDKTPTEESLRACRDFLAAQLYIVQPRVIILLGNTALHSVLGTEVGKISDCREQLFWLGEIPVLAEYHPSYLLRQTNPNTLEKLVEQACRTFHRATGILNGSEPWPEPPLESVDLKPALFPETFTSFTLPPNLLERYSPGRSVEAAKS